MKHKHFNPFTLSTYLSAERSTSTIMLPLVVCQECRRSLETLSEWLEALDHFDPLVGPEYATRYEHFFRLFRENDGHKERLEAIETDELYQHWGLTHLLIEESRNQTPSDPVHAKEFAELALKECRAAGSGLLSSEVDRGPVCGCVRHPCRGTLRSRGC